jgi:hypothetical protein
MNKHFLTVSIASSVLLLFCWIAVNTIAVAYDNQITSQKKNLRIAVAGDWGCKVATQRTASLIKSKNPDIVLGLGDFSYEDDTGCWFKIMGPLISKTKIVIGEHDFDTQNNSRLHVYVNRFNLSNPFYSSNYGDVHFLAMSSLIPFNNQSLPYKLMRDETAQREFVSNDLFYASQNKSINWIIVYLYKPMYTSPTQHPAQETLRDTYHSLFDYYGVDLVLQAHNHNYQRSYPLRYNHTNSSSPIIADRNPSVYNDPKGTIFLVVGTGGAHQYDLLGKAPYIVTQFQRFGFLNIDILDNGTRLVGTFIDDRDGQSKDQFTITKK